MVLLRNALVWFLTLPAIMAAVPEAHAADTLRVFVSILPQQYVVQQIGAQHVDAQVLVPPGADPHTYEPKPGQMAEMAGAQIYFSVGISFEKVWLPKISAANPQMKVVASDRGIAKLPMENHGHATAHGHGPDSDEKVLDPHVWLSPPLVKIMGQTVQAALAEAAPAYAESFENNYREFARRMDDLDAQIRTLLKDKQGTHFISLHPSWGYFAETYGLVQIPVEIQGKEPKAAQLRDLIREAREMKITVIFTQPQFSTRSAQLIAEEIGGRVIPADPLAADLPANLLKQAQAFKAAAR